MKLTLAVTMICLVFNHQPMVYSGIQTTSSVSFGTDPVGAEIFIDGQSRGYTPLALSTPVGLHEIRISLPGFIDSVQEVNIDPKNAASLTLFVKLLPGNRLIPLPNNYVSQSEWNYQGNIIQLTMGVDTHVLNNYDVKTKTMIVANQNINSVNSVPDAVSSKLLNIGLAEQQGVFASPSGRYVAFPAVRSYQTGFGLENGSFLELFDISTKQYISTDAFLPNQYSLKWSPDESWLLIIGGNYSSFVHIENSSVVVFNDARFKDPKGQTVNTSYEISGPSNQGMAVLHGNTTGLLDPNWEWLVDLKTMMGQPIPFSQVFDVQFTDNNQYFYAATDQGIKKISIDLKTAASFDDVISARWGVKAVTLSPGMKYAFIISGGAEFSENWIYQISSQ